MLDRIALGDVPAKPHTALRSPSGALRYEECLTRNGFDGPFSMLYHEAPPHALVRVDPDEAPPGAAPSGALATLTRRHFRTGAVSGESASAGTLPLLVTRTPLLFNDDVCIAVARLTASDAAYASNADGDDLYFVRSGAGTLRSTFGDLPFHEGDYVCVPKGVVHRFVVDAPAELLAVEWSGGVGIPKQWRNEVGQLRMDAPYSHRDFRRPVFRGPVDEGLRDLVVKRAGMAHRYRARGTPLDVVGWDGTVYPWAFPILAFQPRVSSVHLPPTWHGTFAGRGALLCSFVPRPLDFGPDAIPCPYPHSSVDVDEVLYYVSGAFGSRRGVEAGSITLHPAGIPHGPHPGRYEESLGAKRTEEVAVMLDCHRPLRVTEAALAVEDGDYDTSFLGEP